EQIFERQFGPWAQTCTFLSDTPSLWSSARSHVPSMRSQLSKANTSASMLHMNTRNGQQMASQTGQLSPPFVFIVRNSLCLINKSSARECVKVGTFCAYYTRSTGTYITIKCVLRGCNATKERFDSI